MTKDEELIEREATARAIEGLKWAPGQTIDDAIAFIASAVRNDRVFPAADRLEALARPVVGVEGLSMLSAMLDTDIAREGPMASFMIRAGLLREILDCLSALAASPSPVVGDREAIGWTELCYLIERMCPDKPDSNFGRPLSRQVEALADAILHLSTPVVGGEAAAIAELHRIVEGIDRTELEDDKGWWSTSPGEEFGAEVLAKLERLVMRLALTQEVGWMPIERIQDEMKDGREVLLFTDTRMEDEREMSIHRAVGGEHFTAVQVGYWEGEVDAPMRKERAGWRTLRIGKPTHFRPLPEPPAPNSHTTDRAGMAQEVE